METAPTKNNNNDVIVKETIEARNDEVKARQNWRKREWDDMWVGFEWKEEKKPSKEMVNKALACMKWIATHGLLMHEWTEEEKKIYKNQWIAAYHILLNTKYRHELERGWKEQWSKVLATANVTDLENHKKGHYEKEWAWAYMEGAGQKFVKIMNLWEQEQQKELSKKNERERGRSNKDKEKTIKQNKEDKEDSWGLRQWVDRKIKEEDENDELRNKLLYTIIDWKKKEVEVDEWGNVWKKWKINQNELERGSIKQWNDAEKYAIPYQLPALQEDRWDVYWGSEEFQNFWKKQLQENPNRAYHASGWDLLWQTIEATNDLSWLNRCLSVEILCEGNGHGLKGALKIQQDRFEKKERIVGQVMGKISKSRRDNDEENDPLGYFFESEMDKEKMQIEMQKLQSLKDSYAQSYMEAEKECGDWDSSSEDNELIDTIKKKQSLAEKRELTATECKELAKKSQGEVWITEIGRSISHWKDVSMEEWSNQWRVWYEMAYQKGWKKGEGSEVKHYQWINLLTSYKGPDWDEKKSGDGEIRNRWIASWCAREFCRLKNEGYREWSSQLVKKWEWMHAYYEESGKKGWIGGNPWVDSGIVEEKDSIAKSIWKLCHESNWVGPWLEKEVEKGAKKRIVQDMLRWGMEEEKEERWNMGEWVENIVKGQDWKKHESWIKMWLSKKPWTWNDQGEVYAVMNTLKDKEGKKWWEVLKEKRLLDDAIQTSRHAENTNSDDKEVEVRKTSFRL